MATMLFPTDSQASDVSRSRPFEVSETVWGVLFISPAVLLIGLLALIPIAGAIWLSLHHYLPIFQIYEFVSVRNFLRVIHDARFWGACQVTAYFTTVSVALE